MVINDTFAHDEPTERGLRYKRNKQIHIYSNSWGPSDNGRTVKGPGPLVKEALKNGARRVSFAIFFAFILVDECCYNDCAIMSIALYIAASVFIKARFSVRFFSYDRCK